MAHNHDAARKCNGNINNDNPHSKTNCPDYTTNYCFSKAPGQGMARKQSTNKK